MPLPSLAAAEDVVLLQTSVITRYIAALLFFILKNAVFSEDCRPHMVPVFGDKLVCRDTPRVRNTYIRKAPWAQHQRDI